MSYEPLNSWKDMEGTQDRHEWLECCINEATGFCGCGSPDEAYETLRRVLIILKVRSEKWGRDTDYKRWYPGFLAGLQVTIGYKTHVGAAYAYLYWIDHMDLTEHGGAVPGWLTTKGEMVLGWLNELCT